MTAPPLLRSRRERSNARVRALLLHPDVWQLLPAGRFTAWDYRSDNGVRQAWRDIHRFLVSYGVVSPRTAPIDVNVPKLVETCRALAKGTKR